MRFPSLSRIFIAAIFASVLFSCNKKEDFVSEDVKDYLLITPGKYITYRLDSMVFTNFGTTTEIHKYQVKHVVDALITDNLGRPGYRVYRFIRDSVDATSWTPAQPWTNSGTYFITPLTDQVELIEDNLRIIKLHMPVRESFSWKGNKYLPTDPYGQYYGFSNDDNMADWDFYYDGGSTSFSYKGNNYSNVYSIEEADESFNVPITIPTAYAAKSRAVEKYSKNIGLVYREYELWEYQPPPVGPYKTGFGVTQWMIDHN
ncbi:MAG: hypothetical protein HZB42_00220 [Sphingobacteriales bacterium]|nr:hypothetical protein [Sphingobacteriales bacterium]